MCRGCVPAAAAGGSNPPCGSPLGVIPTFSLSPCILSPHSEAIRRADEKTLNIPHTFIQYVLLLDLYTHVHAAVQSRGQRAELVSTHWLQILPVGFAARGSFCFSSAGPFQDSYWLSLFRCRIRLCPISPLNTSFRAQLLTA